MTRTLTVALSFAVVAALTACTPTEPKLPGERISLDGAEASESVNTGVPISLGGQVALSQWTQKSANAAHAAPHNALNFPLTLTARTVFGTGNDRKHRISADPVAAGGRLYVMDATARVSAVSPSGTLLWTRDISPLTDPAAQGSGGGLATDGRRVFATSGLGRVVALDAASGAELWVQELDAGTSGAPTLAGDKVLVSSRDGRAWAIAASDGKVEWQENGLAGSASVLGSGAPAVTGDTAVFAFSSGELLALEIGTGTPKWRASVPGRRPGFAIATLLRDVSGEPVISGGRVYAGSVAGRAVAVDASTGEQLWTVAEGAMSPVAVAGGAVFMVSDRGELMRLNAATGARVWSVPLGDFRAEKVTRRKAHFNHFGPVLAGGAVVIASDDGNIRAFSPVDGTLLSSTPLPGGAASNPIVVNGTLYVVSADGALLSFR